MFKLASLECAFDRLVDISLMLYIGVIDNIWNWSLIHTLSPCVKVVIVWSV